MLLRAPPLNRPASCRAIPYNVPLSPRVPRASAAALVLGRERELARPASSDPPTSQSPFRSSSLRALLRPWCPAKCAGARPWNDSAPSSPREAGEPPPGPGAHSSLPSSPAVRSDWSSAPIESVRSTGETPTPPAALACLSACAGCALPTPSQPASAPAWWCAPSPARSLTTAVCHHPAAPHATSSLGRGGSS